MADDEQANKKAEENINIVRRRRSRLLPVGPPPSPLHMAASELSALWERTRGGDARTREQLTDE